MDFTKKYCINWNNRKTEVVNRYIAAQYKLLFTFDYCAYRRQTDRRRAEHKRGRYEIAFRQKAHPIVCCSNMFEQAPHVFFIVCATWSRKLQWPNEHCIHHSSGNTAKDISTLKKKIDVFPDCLSILTLVPKSWKKSLFIWWESETHWNRWYFGCLREKNMQ